MDDPSSLFSVEDDGSLLILNRISEAEEDRLEGENDASSGVTITITPFSGKSDANNTSNSVDAKVDDDCQEDDRDGAFELLLSSDDDEESEMAGGITMRELEPILEKEQENLDLIRKANEMIRSMITISSSSASSQTKTVSRDAAVNTSNNVDAGKGEEGSIAEKQGILETTGENGGVAVKHYQKMLNRMSLHFRRRRRTNARLNNENPLNVQAFVQDYYRSLDSVSRYIIAASMLSFLTAFLLLSWYSAQIHSYDMEFFGLKERRAIANQEAFERYQLEKENLRESLIHQRYEESRECQSFLQSCHSKRDELFAQISNLEQDNVNSRNRLEAKVESQRKEIRVLEGKLHEMQEQNKELRKEIGQSFSSSYAKLLLSALNFIQNRSVQIVFGTGLTIVVLLGLISVSFSK